MHTYTCTTCHHPIPRGHAVLRSVSFSLVAYHRECRDPLPFGLVERMRLMARLAS